MQRERWREKDGACARACAFPCCSLGVRASVFITDTHTHAHTRGREKERERGKVAAIYKAPSHAKVMFCFFFPVFSTTITTITASTMEMMSRKQHILFRDFFW